MLVWVVGSDDCAGCVAFNRRSFGGCFGRFIVAYVVFVFLHLHVWISPPFLDAATGTIHLLGVVYSVWLNLLLRIVGRSRVSGEVRFTIDRQWLGKWGGEVRKGGPYRACFFFFFLFFWPWSWYCDGISDRQRSFQTRYWIEQGTWFCIYLKRLPSISEDGILMFYLDFDFDAKASKRRPNRICIWKIVKEMFKISYFCECKEFEQRLEFGKGRNDKKQNGLLIENVRSVYEVKVAWYPKLW